MLNRGQQDTLTKGPIPKCPQCRASMPHISWNTNLPGEWIPGGVSVALLTFFCPQCLTVINCQIVPITQILTPQQVAQLQQAGRAQG